MMEYRASIGLEVHVQLRTKTKIFCGCPNAFGGEPNTQVCPVCLGYPGALPVLNQEAVKLTVMTGLMIGSQISRYSKFDRKNYFYPDMPKNYQISQYDLPLCVGGRVEYRMPDGPKVVRITRIHLEEDVGKSFHFERSSGVDFNRAGTPLMEIVTEPDMETPDEAFAFLQALKQILLYGNISDCNLEEGNIRCDVNVSVRPADSDRLGTKVEIKNMNTFKGIRAALEYEIHRQTAELKAGRALIQETRRWDPDVGVTESMRTKEYAHDYRYFPEPDLMPVALTDAQIEAWRAMLPELPQQRRARLIREYGLPEYDAGVLVAEKTVADFYEKTARLCGNFKAASNWVMTELLRHLSEKEMELSSARITPESLAALIRLVENGTLNMPSAREVFATLFEQGGDPETIVKERGLAQVSDTGALEAMVDKAIADNPRSVADFKSGKAAALQFLVGQVMRASRGKANPQTVQQILKRKLG